MSDHTPRQPEDIRAEADRAIELIEGLMHDIQLAREDPEDSPYASEVKLDDYRESVVNALAAAIRVEDVLNQGDSKGLVRECWKLSEYLTVLREQLGLDDE